MSLPIKLISTDFDGTIFAEFENPPVPVKLQETIARLQKAGTKWLINTGRDISGLMEAMARARLTVKPDFLVLVEREIYYRRDGQYVELSGWNRACNLAHGKLFKQVRGDVPRLTAWVHRRFNATIYEDLYSPFCLIAERNQDADAIHVYLEEYCQEIPQLTVVRNDVYARFSHAAFNKGSALLEIAGREGIGAHETFAVGDHMNDLTMLTKDCAHWLAAPGNAIQPVKAAVRANGGYVSRLQHGHGVLESLDYYINKWNSAAGKKAV